jgi:site-specific DNA-cytosine methylase
MRVLVACEYSGAVRDAFIRAGHYAASCDLLPSESPLGDHYQCDVTDIIGNGWDLMVAHPPCTYLSVSGMHWTTRGLRDPKLTEDALDFVKLLMDAPIERIAIENPVSIISSRLRKPEQIIQPWWFGHDASKKTCLWLKNLPLLTPTNMLEGDNKTRRANQTASGQNKLPPSADRWKLRSMTYTGIADAMAQQWGSI